MTRRRARPAKPSAAGAAPRLRRALTRAAVTMLALLGSLFYFTFEPAPQVLVRWRQDATPERRADIERRFGLVRPWEPEGRAIMYDLLDTRPANVQELLEQPEIEGSGYVDDASYTVTGDALAGRGWTWIVQQQVFSPELRAYRVLPAVMTACVLVIAGGMAADVASRRRAIRRRWAVVARRWSRRGAENDSSTGGEPAA